MPKENLRLIGPDDVREMLIAHAGFDPGPLDAALAKPLSEKALQHPLMRLLPRGKEDTMGKGCGGTKKKKKSKGK